MILIQWCSLYVRKQWRAVYQNKTLCLPPNIERRKSLKDNCTEYLLLISNQRGASILITVIKYFYPLQSAPANGFFTPRTAPYKDFAVVGRTYYLMQSNTVRLYFNRGLSWNSYTQIQEFCYMYSKTVSGYPQTAVQPQHGGVARALRPWCVDRRLHGNRVSFDSHQIAAYPIVDTPQHADSDFD